MASTAVFPTLTTISESVLSAVRNNYSPTSWRRVKTTHRKAERRQNSEQSKGSRSANEEYTRLVTALILHADNVTAGLIVNVVKGDDTTELITIAGDKRSTLCQEIALSDSYSRANHPTNQTASSSSQHKRGLLHLHHPSPMTSSHHVTRPLHTRTTVHSQPQYTASPSKVLAFFRRRRQLMDADVVSSLERIIAARAVYEAEPSVTNALQVHIAELLRHGYVRHRGVNKKMVEKLRLGAEAKPHDAQAQALYLVALYINGADIGLVITSKQFALNTVTIGLLQESSGFRERIEAKATSASEIYTKKWMLMFHSIGKTFMIVVYFFIASVLYNSFSSSGSKGGGLGNLLGDDGSYEVMTPTVTFEDVAGIQHAVQEMEELVGYLTDPAKYTEMGCQIPKGYLLCGPPGVGKTLLAKALAGEAAVPFYYASGSGFEEIFVGVGAGRIRKMFEEAQENAPSIIFIDEIDSIGQKRKLNEMGYSNRATLNQMLSCMDGFENNNGVIVIAATNEAETLDPALMREGRFDTKISIRAPTIQGRLDILRVHTRNKVLADDVELENLAAACVGMTGAQLATVANTAALRAVLEDRDNITQDDFEFARARLLIGHINEDISVSDKELLNTAAHEAGHAILTVLREEITQRPVYITTILPRGNSLGHVMPVSKVDQHTQNIAQLIAQIDISIAGRVGEELHYNFAKDRVTTGCSSDMRTATYYAEMLVKKCGYSNKIGLSKVVDQKDDLTERVVHEEIKKLFDERYQVVKSDLLKHKKEWAKLTDLLYQYKTLTGGEVKTILAGGVPDRKPGEMLPSH